MLTRNRFLADRIVAHLLLFSPTLCAHPTLAADNPKAVTQGYEGYRWDMILSDALKVKSCRLVRISLGPSGSPADDTLTVLCAKSPYANSPAIALLRFKKDQLKAIEFTYALNQQALTSLLKADQDELAITKSTHAEKLPSRTSLRTIFGLADNKQVSAVLKLKEAEFAPIFEKLVQRHAQPSFGGKPSENESGFASWMADKKWMSVRANFIMSSDGLKIATVMLAAKDF